MFSILRKKPAVEKKGLAEPGDDLYALFGMAPTTSGNMTVTPSSALRVPAVGSAIRVIAEAVACLDVEVKRIEADGTEVVIPNHPALTFLRDQANDWTSGFELLRDLVIDALSDDTGGMAFASRVNGRIVEVIRYRRGVMQVDLDRVTGEPSYKLDVRAVDSGDVIHLRSPFGKSPLTLAKEAIGTAMALDVHASKLFGGGARPTGVLSFPKGLGEDAVRKVRAAWRATHEGNDAGGRTAVLLDGVEFHPHAFTSTDAQFLENRRFQVLEIARAFRVPPSMLYDFERATWANAEQAGYEFLTYTLEPWLRALEGSLRRVMFSAEERVDHVIRFDRDDLTRADLSTRAQAINSLISSQVINPNEGRLWLGRPPRDGGEVFLNPNISTSPEEQS